MWSEWEHSWRERHQGRCVNSCGASQFLRGHATKRMESLGLHRIQNLWFLSLISFAVHKNNFPLKLHIETLADQGSEDSAHRPAEAPHTLSCKMAGFRSVTFYRATLMKKDPRSFLLVCCPPARPLHAPPNDFSARCDWITWKLM